MPQKIPAAADERRLLVLGVIEPAEKCVLILTRRVRNGFTESHHMPAPFNRFSLPHYAAASLSKVKYVSATSSIVGTLMSRWNMS